MSSSDYEELTGQTVPATRQPAVDAALRRSQSILENLLGYPLDPDQVTTSQWTETGKLGADNVFSCDYLDNATLLPPDPVVGALRVFDFYPADAHLPIDPFATIYAVKLVVGNVTIARLKPSQYSGRPGRNGLAKYLDIHKDWLFGFGLGFTTGSSFDFTAGASICGCGRHTVMLAVDADWCWSDELPEDLQFVMAEMAGYYADPSRNVRSESVGTRSYTKADTTTPQDYPANAHMLVEYAGAHGSLNRRPLA